VNFFSNITRDEGDPKILRTGSSSVGPSDRLSRALGWFSIGLGLVELLAPRRVTTALGMEGNEALVRAYGVREIGGGVLSLSVDKTAGLWSRVAGDGLDIATLLAANHQDNPKRNNVAIGLALVVGVTLLDLAGAMSVSSRHSRGSGRVRDYSDRSGFPRGVEQARGAAKDFKVPADMRATI